MSVLDYQALSALESKSRMLVRSLEDAEQRIDDECCAQHGLGEVEDALKQARALHATVAGAMLDALRKESA